jgi:hypothetical protein
MCKREGSDGNLTFTISHDLLHALLACTLHCAKILHGAMQYKAIQTRTQHNTTQQNATQQTQHQSPTASPHGKTYTLSHNCIYRCIYSCYSLTEHSLESSLVIPVLRLYEEREIGVHFAHIDHSLLCMGDDLERYQRYIKMLRSTGKKQY